MPVILRPYEAVYHRLLRRATVSVKLTYKEFLKFTEITRCHYCGQTVNWLRRATRGANIPYNLDRKDNTKVYTKQNCVVCCKICNQAKSNVFTYEEFLLIGKVIRRIFHERKHTQRH